MVDLLDHLLELLIEVRCLLLVSLDVYVVILYKLVVVLRPLGRLLDQLEALNLFLECLQGFPSVYVEQLK